jgi:D-alanine-D-alanine ligase
VETLKPHSANGFVSDLFSNWHAVVIADTADTPTSLSLTSETLDVYSTETIAEIVTVLRSLFRGVTVYSNPSVFVDHIACHKEHLVFPLWSGVRSRNRTSLVASICEAYDIRYLGGDTFTNIVGQDKAISKRLAESAGLLTPASVLIYTTAQLSTIDLLDPPVVVKPNLQGSSIGISQHSLCRNSQDAQDVAAQLLAIYDQPVLVEQFIEGAEVTAVLVGDETEVRLCEVMELYDADGRIDFSRTLDSFELKKGPTKPRRAHRRINTSQAVSVAMQELFIRLGNLRYVIIKRNMHGSRIPVAQF